MRGFMVAVAVFFSVTLQVGNAQVIGKQNDDVRPCGSGCHRGKHDAGPTGNFLDCFHAYF